MDAIDTSLNLFSDSYILIFIAFVAGMLFVSFGRMSTSKASEKRKSIWWLIAIIASLLAALATMASLFKNTFHAGPSLGFHFNLGLISTAHAQTATTHTASTNDLASYIVGGIFVVIFITFIASILVMFFTADEDRNQRKLAAADNIIKTFGGFFIGVATSFANQTIGVVGG